MARTNAVEGEPRTTRRRHRRDASPPRDDDWVENIDLMAPRPRRKSEILRHESGRHVAAHRQHKHRTSSSVSRPPLSSSSSMRVSSSLAAATAMPLLMRSSTLPAESTSLSKVPPPPPPFVYDDDRSRSRSDSRKAGSHRDGSPRSMYHRRSTPMTRESSDGSETESDNETEATDHSNEETLDIIPDKEALRSRINSSRREERPPRRQPAVVYEEDQSRDRHRRHRSYADERDYDDERGSPSRASPDRHGRHRSSRYVEDERSPSRAPTDQHDRHRSSRSYREPPTDVEDSQRLRSTSRR